MGYNPYMCIVCGAIEDNGWFSAIGPDYYSRCCEIIQRLNLKFDMNNDRYDGNYIITYDVCHKCYRKGQSVIDPFFAIKRSKQERKEYWNMKQNNK